MSTEFKKMIKDWLQTKSEKKKRKHVGSYKPKTKWCRLRLSLKKGCGKGIRNAEAKMTRTLAFHIGICGAALHTCLCPLQSSSSIWQFSGNFLVGFLFFFSLFNLTTILTLPFLHPIIQTHVLTQNLLPMSPLNFISSCHELYTICKHKGKATKICTKYL